ncbi:MAG: hypothetical protein ACRDGL_05755 [Candidatus Limnocylindrales bacterium]
MPLIVLIAAIDLIVLAPVSAWLALQRGRSPSGWFVLAAIIGPVAFLALAFAPTSWEIEERRTRTRPCDLCGTLVPGSASRCYACAAPLDPLPAAPEAAAVEAHAPATSVEPSVAPAMPRPALDPSESPSPSGIVPRLAPLADRSPALEAVLQPAAGDRPDPGPAHRATPRGSKRRLSLADVDPVATGALVGGDLSVGLGELGERFIVGTWEDSVIVFGPIGASHEKVVLEAPRDTVEVTRVPDGFIMAAEPEPGRSVRIAFRNPATSEVDRAIAQLDRDNRPVAHLGPEAKPRSGGGQAAGPANGTRRPRAAGPRRARTSG